jgi:hypothetical protein
VEEVATKNGLNILENARISLCYSLFYDGLNDSFHLVEKAVNLITVYARV